MRTHVSTVAVSLLLVAGLSTSVLAAPAASSAGSADQASVSALSTKVCADPSEANLAKMKSALTELAAQPGGGLLAAQAAQTLASCAASMAESNPAGAVAVASLAADVLLIPDVLVAAQGTPGMVASIKASLESVEAAAKAQGISTAGLSPQLEQVAQAELTATPTAAGGDGPGGTPTGVSAPFGGSFGSVNGGGGTTVASPAQ